MAHRFLRGDKDASNIHRQQPLELFLREIRNRRQMMSSRPNFSTLAVTARLTATGSALSAWMAKAGLPPSVMDRTISSAFVLEAE
jgi:hypothetical protein